MRTCACTPASVHVQEHAVAHYSTVDVRLWVYLPVCRLTIRMLSNCFSAQKFSTGNMFTHHQKTIILDAPMPSSSSTPAAAAAAAAGAAAGPPACDPATLEHLSTPKKGDGAQGGAFSESSGGARRVVAFIGGLDLTDGRYDR
jgi:hypothetical protein